MGGSERIGSRQDKSLVVDVWGRFLGCYRSVRLTPEFQASEPRFGQSDESFDLIGLTTGASVSNEALQIDFALGLDLLRLDGQLACESSRLGEPAPCGSKTPIILFAN